MTHGGVCSHHPYLQLEDRNMSYVVYAHINKTNGKVYVGQTSQDINQRWRNGKGYINNTLFYRAIEKYGWDGFEHKIIYTELTKREADEKEIEMIAFYNSNNPERGYNLTIGGGGTSGYHLTEEQKRKISEVQKGRKLTEEWKLHISDAVRGKKHPFYGKKLSEEHIKHLSDAHLGQVSAKGMLGKKHSEETKKRMSEAQTGHIVSQESRKKIGEANSKKVRCVETDVIYHSMPEASKSTGCSVVSICRCCKGQQETSKRYHWEYAN